MLFKKMIDKGFKRVVYRDQKGSPVYYRFRTEDPELVESIAKFLKEDVGYFEGDYNGIYCVIEITEDLSFAQYLFAEIEFKFGGQAFDPLTMEEFEVLVDFLPVGEQDVRHKARIKS